MKGWFASRAQPESEEELLSWGADVIVSACLECPIVQTAVAAGLVKETRCLSICLSLLRAAVGAESEEKCFEMYSDLYAKEETYSEESEKQESEEETYSDLYAKAKNIFAAKKFQMELQLLQEQEKWGCIRSLSGAGEFCLPSAARGLHQPPSYIDIQAASRGLHQPPSEQTASVPAPAPE